MSQAPHNPLEDNAPHREADDREEIYYQGSPMLRGKLGHFLLMVLIALIIAAIPYLIGNFHVHWIAYLVCWVVALGIILYPWLLTKSIRYRITNYRIDFERGLFGKRIDTLELWHVEDIRFEQSFTDRILGVGTIVVFSSDDTTPRLPMRGLPNPRPLFDKVKQRVIAVKRQRGVVKMDVGGHLDAN